MRKNAAVARQDTLFAHRVAHPSPPPASNHGFSLGQIGTLIVSGTILVVLWHLLVTLADTPAYLLPGPLAVFDRFHAVWRDGTLQQHLVPTIVESLGGFALALVAGAAAGYAVAQWRGLERLIAPYVAAIQAIPVIAIAPLIIIWFGFNNDVLRNTIIAAFVVVFPIFSSTLTGVRTIPRELREVGLVEGATRWQQLRFIELPLALPVVFSGMRTSVAYATTGAVVGEFLGSTYGLGVLINVARGRFDVPLIFVALLCLITITIVLYLVLRAVEHVATRWLE